MKVFLFFVILLAGCSSANKINPDYRLYQLSDMEDVLQDYYANDLKKMTPGLACGAFKMDNHTGCFKLIVDNSNGKVVKLIYEEEYSGGEKLEIYSIEPPTGKDNSANHSIYAPFNNMYIEKLFQQKIESSRSLSEKKVILKEGQPSLKLAFFGKSAVAFYWKNGKFNQIWVSD